MMVVMAIYLFSLKTFNNISVIRIDSKVGHMSCGEVTSPDQVTANCTDHCLHTYVQSATKIIIYFV